jgi:hypothetical protein
MVTWVAKGVEPKLIVRKIRFCNLAVRLAVVSWLFFSIGLSAEAADLEPITLAQAPSLYPTDVTHVGIQSQQEMMRPGPAFYFYKKLPARLWFNLSAETSGRYESNVYLKQNGSASDFVYRILPNISLGYEFYRRTSIYTNYFALKDVFADHSKLSFPTTQSLALGLRHTLPTWHNTVVQFDMQARELWQSVGLRQFDYIPGVTITKTLDSQTAIFSNLLLQLRGGQPFVAPTREIDPFYTLGIVRSKGSWVFTAVGTLVTNFRHPPFNDSIPPFSNNAIIADFEASHPVTRSIPNLVAFIRAEPIWNWDSHHYPGISGFDFRLFGGLRYFLVKPTYHQSVDKLKHQLQQVDTEPQPLQSMPNIPSLMP